MTARSDRETLTAFLAALHHGGTHGYWWTLEGRRSDWWEVGKMTPPPGGKRNVYFGVHPVDVIPTKNRRGADAPSTSVRSHIDSISAINCLFAEFDDKDYSSPADCRAAVDALDPSPSVVIASGGGYHCYWLLAKPWRLADDDTRQRAATAQAGWVALMGGDGGAKDLARVLRVPGTFNHKHTPPRPVVFVRCDLDVRYQRSDLLRLIPKDDPAPPTETTGATPTDRATDWAKRKLSDAIRMVATANDGKRHTVLLKAAKLCGGLTPHVTEAEIVRALTSAAPAGWEDDREVERVILDGIAYGQQSPLQPPPTPPALQWRGGVAYCPRCGAETRRSKFYDDGLFCSCERPALTWRGAEIAPPPGITVDRTWRDGAEESPDDRPIYVVGPTAPHGITTLIDTPPPPVTWFAPGFLREGLGLLVGQPNVGKTPLAAQLGLALASGRKWMDSVDVKRSKVLYLGCEYSRQELYPLLTESMGAMSMRLREDITDDNFAFKTQDDALPNDPDAAIADLEFYISLGFNVIIIDTLTAFLPPEKFKQSVYRGDYKELQPYHRLALKYSVAILGVWHASKRESDPKLMYNGSTGMWAVPSSRISMYEDEDGRKRISSFPRLGDRADLALTQAKNVRGRYWVAADAVIEPPQLSATEKVIYAWLRENSSKAQPRSASVIAEMTSVKPNTVKSALARMFDDNLVQQAGRGLYFVGSFGSSGSFGSFGSFGSSVKTVLTEDPDGSILDLEASLPDALKHKDPKDPTFSRSPKIQQDPTLPDRVGSGEIPHQDAIPTIEHLTAMYTRLQELKGNAAPDDHNEDDDE
jgi:hypothetical protein